MFRSFKRSTLTLALGGLLLSGAVMAQPPGNGYMQNPAMPIPMTGEGCHHSQGMWHRGMWRDMSLLRLVEHHAYRLKLTDKQASEIAIWHNQHLKVAMQSREALRKDMMALHKAALAGNNRSELNAIAERIDHQRARLLAMHIDQIELIKRVLTPAQWTQVTHLIAREHHQTMGPSEHKHFRMGN